MSFNVNYEPGELFAIGKNNGKNEAKSVLTTAGEPKKIVLIPNKTQMIADGKDCIHIHTQIHDLKGNLVQLNDKQINFAISGKAQLLGIDNGNLSDFTEKGAYLRNSCSTYWGELLLIVQSQKEAGIITITAESEGLPTERINLKLI
jgi:beta-galactosidase